MIKIKKENDSLSLLKSLQDDDEENKDLVTIKLESQTAQISYSQLCKYSQLISEEYLISDVKNRLSQEILQFQQENHIDIKNIIIFFKLFDEEEISITNDKFKDFFKLSEFFKITKLIKQLKIYFRTHSTDVDFVIRLFLDEIEKNDSTYNVDFEFTSGMEQVMADKIDECLQNENFCKIPVSFIYNILTQINEEKLKSDNLFNFIKKSPENHFVFLKFLKIEKLTKNKFDEFCELFCNTCHAI